VECGPRGSWFHGHRQILHVKEDRVLLRDRLRAQIAGIGAGYGISRRRSIGRIFSNPLVGDPASERSGRRAMSESMPRCRGFSPAWLARTSPIMPMRIPAVFAFVGSNGTARAP
jgi:hypothetical protein